MPTTNSNSNLTTPVALPPADSSRNPAAGRARTSPGRSGNSSDPGHSSGSDSGPVSSDTSRKKISHRHLYNLTSQLAIMTRTGVDVSSALESVARNSKRQVVSDILGTVHSDLMDGKPFSSALARFPKTFDATYVATVAAGEASGDMPGVLTQLANLQRNDIRLHSSVRKVLIYPVILMVVSTLVLTGLVVFVLPQFAGIFEEFETPLPWITRVLIEISLEFRSHWWLWSSVMIGAITGLVALWKSSFGRQWIDRFLLTAPMIGNVTSSLIFGRVCRLLGLMVESGVPLLDSVRLARQSISNHLYQELFDELEDDILNGRGIATGLMSSAFIPAAAAEMVVTGEQTGQMGPVTHLVGEHYEELGEAKLRDMVAMLEPIITVIMGTLVAVVVLAVMLPMFDIATLANK